MKLIPFFLFLIIFLSCGEKQSEIHNENPIVVRPVKIPESSLIVLGTIQDGGSPHIGCKKDCCKGLYEKPDPMRKVVSLGLVHQGKTYLFEATPDITSQLKSLQTMAGSADEFPDGIFISHAHIGHYTGLMFLGKEAASATEIPVYTMPRMQQFLESNGPWDALVANKNISLQKLRAGEEVTLAPQLKVTPLLVPHRDEYSETIGFMIDCEAKRILFIPDIDKWQKWKTSIIKVISEVDHAFIDATFFDGEEIQNRDISEIPHPFIIESMAMFEALSASEKNKIHFIHFNHTNPVLDTNSTAYKEIIRKGYHITRTNDVINLE
ncbi:MAG: pyrroloquinoline quinone biosynthesis protein PqqB [Flavobacterium sp.]|nr:MAG: pyrroloquinoline quinone biosynthesis protein PqqB [Flavobacterium sp.]